MCRRRRRRPAGRTAPGGGPRPGHVQQRPAGGHGPHRRAEPAHPRRFAGRQLVAHVEAPGGGEVGDEGDRRRRGAGRFRRSDRFKAPEETRIRAGEVAQIAPHRVVQRPDQLQAERLRRIGVAQQLGWRPVPSGVVEDVAEAGGVDPRQARDAGVELTARGASLVEALRGQRRRRPGRRRHAERQRGEEEGEVASADGGVSVEAPPAVAAFAPLSGGKCSKKRSGVHGERQCLGRTQRMPQTYLMAFVERQELAALALPAVAAGGLAGAAVHPLVARRVGEDLVQRGGQRGRRRRARR